MSNLDEIEAILKSLLSPPRAVSMPDIDELLMLVEESRSLLPNRFLELSDTLDSFDIDAPEEHPWFYETCKRLLRVLEVQERIVRKRANHTGSLTPVFTLEEKDKNRVLKLCSDMRKIVLASTDFDHPHKIRLANRIAAIEDQIHREKGMFDVILGGVSDIGETLGKFGKNIKPLTDRMNEVMKITRKATKEYDQIPPPEEVKQLPKPNSPKKAMKNNGH